MLIWHLFYFDLIFVVLDIWAFSICCWVFDWSRLWWDLTTCLSVDCYEGLFEVINSIDVPEMSRWTDDCWCLLDALRWAPWNVGVWFDFMLFRSSTMGSRCRQTPTIEGGVTIWICSDHSSIDNPWSEKLSLLQNIWIESSGTLPRTYLDSSHA